VSTSIAPSIEQKPRFRGRLHQAAFFVVLPAGIALIALAPTAPARVAAVVYAFGLAGLYGVSAAYHRLPWSPRSRNWMRRLDHSMIFVFVAGTYTPLCILVLRSPWSWVLLTAVWAGAALGVVLKMVRIDGFQALGGALYVVVGWMAILAAPEFVRGLDGPLLGLVALGGILYTTGAIVLARKRPDPAPATFGYHEIFHSFVIGGTACHYAVILIVLLSLRSTIGG
jgi:hemolysin III